MKLSFLLPGLACLCTQLSTAQPKPQPFKSGDRVVFAGNSITEAGLYGSNIWLYYMTHFPERKIQVLNAGVGGDVAEQIYKRLDDDILAKKPTVLAVTFGMNDSKYFEYNSPNPDVNGFVKTSYDSYLKIEKKLQELKGVKKIIMASSPYDENVQLPNNNAFKGKFKTMEKIIEFQKASAFNNNWSYVDFFYPMAQINLREQKKNPVYTASGNDRIHPSSAGHLVMAYIFLKSQGLAGSCIADVSVDYAAGKVVKSVNAKSDKVLKIKDGIRFDYLANSLPFPIDTVPRVWMNPEVQSEALKIVPFNEEFNNERLVVRNLPAGRYTLRIDRDPVAEFSAHELAAGINIATLKNTPQYQQSLQVLKLSNERREIEGKFRSYFWVNYNFLADKKMLFDKSSAARDTIEKYAPSNGWLNGKKNDWEMVREENSGKMLESKMNALVDEIYRVNKPKKHTIEIVAVSFN
ncbi:SGNH/GDSL hydrolase family protein [Desertivirga arenae]|uniref:SGNH/GDSL hydrolase family protein n=1 Tax=Desertivirga arenae TaxID=2810309 RepID=UPI001A9563F1|nr:SGNH/GDSL hydrolase family protein [Pedobacter sp. SYSU D00823]